MWLSGNGPNDAQILAFTPEGTFLRQIGASGKMAGSNDTANCYATGKPVRRGDRIVVRVGW